MPNFLIVAINVMANYSRTGINPFNSVILENRDNPPKNRLYPQALLIDLCYWNAAWSPTTSTRLYFPSLWFCKSLKFLRKVIPANAGIQQLQLLLDAGRITAKLKSVYWSSPAWRLGGFLRFYHFVGIRFNWLWSGLCSKNRRSLFDTYRKGLGIIPEFSG